MEKLSASELENLAKQFPHDDSLSGLIIALATCRFIEEKVGTNLPELSLMLFAQDNSKKIAEAMVSASRSSK